MLIKELLGKTNCLLAALDSYAPYSVVKDLLDSGARSASSHHFTVPPLVVLFAQLIKEYVLLYTDSGELDIKALSRTEDPKDKSLKDLCDKVHLLLDKGASLHDSFFYYDCQLDPLSLAASAHSLALIKYVIKKGAVLNSVDPLINALAKKVDNRTTGRKFAVLKALVEASFDTSILLEVFVSLLNYDCLMTDSNFTNRVYTEEEFDYTIELLINRFIAQNASVHQRRKALQHARACNNQKITSLLIEKGFSEVFGRDEKSLIRQIFNKKVVAFLNLIHSQVSTDSQLETTAKQFFSYTQDFIERGGLDAQDFPLLIGFIVDFYSLEEARNVLVCLSAKEFLLKSFMPIPTVLHILVEMSKLVKNLENRNLLDMFLVKVYSLVSLLMQKGVEDTVLVKGETAAQRAYSAGLPELGDCIRYKLKDWETATREVGHDQEKVKKLFLSAKTLITNGQAKLEEMGSLFPYAVCYPHLEEVKYFLLWAASQEPFSLKGFSTYGGVPSVFHAIVEFLGFTKQACPVQILSVVMAEGIVPLVNWLKEQGITDIILREGKTAAERACELGFLELAEAF